MNVFYCVIPARGGSKRIPKKNIQLVGGKPLISHVIENIKESGVFKEIFVSTDSEQIADISTTSGALVPGLRSAHLSDDETPTRPVIADLIVKQQQLRAEGVVIACVYPFAMLVSSDILKSAANYFGELTFKNKYLVSVRRYLHPIQRALAKDSDHSLSPMKPECLEKRTQDLPVLFHDAGQFYFASSRTWIKDEPILSNAIGYELGKYNCIDIDDVEDLEQLRKLYAVQQF